jgi:GT2 family glycosyltransferase
MTVGDPDGHGSRVAIGVIVLAYGDEPYLADCVNALAASVDGDGAPLSITIGLVDNGSPAVTGLSQNPCLRVLTPNRNLGFAGGCNFGAQHTAADTLVFVNSDAIVAPDAIYRLVVAAADERTGLVSGGVRLADEPELMNSAGNPVHFLGLVWAGSYGEKASAHSLPGDIASVSGALFAARTATWRALGGFDEQYFAYHEDADLSLRCWQAGHRVRFLPEAIAWHHYEFSRTPTKQYLLERNRWITLLTVFPGSVLAAIALPLAGFEIAVVAVAARQGWLGDKLRGYSWLLKNVPYLRARRRRVRAANRISTVAFAELLSSRIEPAMLGPITGLAPVNAMLASYWRVCRSAFAAADRVSRSPVRSASARHR